MELRASRDQSCNQRRSHAASHVAHEIHDAGYGVVFLRRNSDVSDQRNRHEQETQSDDLPEAQHTRAPAAESASPANSEVYPKSVCRNCGIRTRELNSEIPRVNIIRLAPAKLKFLNIRTSIIGDFSNHSQTTSDIKHTAATTTKVVMKREPNQSSSWPLSSRICNAPIPTVRRAIPT